ncbi:MAG: hypothetical protein IAF02_17995 [Anaerolineae bacterium]|nr:hypothetical protein [Anaerolineae bacterium]
MNEFEATGVMVLLFALRCVMPFVLLMGVGYFMNRMVDKWERDALAQEAKEREATPESQPGQIFPDKPGITQPAFAKSTVEKQPALQVPCWLIKKCDPATRADCAANQQRGKPCWVARLAVEGALPSGCPDCPIYQAAHA